MSLLEFEICLNVSSIVNCYLLLGINLHFRQRLPEDESGDCTARPASVSASALIVREATYDHPFARPLVLIARVFLDCCAEDSFFGFVELKIVHDANYTNFLYLSSSEEILD